MCKKTHITIVDKTDSTGPIWPVKNSVHILNTHVLQCNLTFFPSILFKKKNQNYFMCDEALYARNIFKPLHSFSIVIVQLICCTGNRNVTVLASAYWSTTFSCAFQILSILCSIGNDDDVLTIRSFHFFDIDADDLVLAIWIENGSAMIGNGVHFRSVFILFIFFPFFILSILVFFARMKFLNVRLAIAEWVLETIVQMWMHCMRDMAMVFGKAMCC